MTSASTFSDDRSNQVVNSTAAKPHFFMTKEEQDKTLPKIAEEPADHIDKFIREQQVSLPQGDVPPALPPRRGVSLSPHAPAGPAPVVRQPFMRRRAFPTGRSDARPAVLTNYSAGLRYILTDEETVLLVRVQACGRGLALRAQLRRWWTAEWQACFYERQTRLWRKMCATSRTVHCV